VGKPEGMKHLEDPSVEGRIILRWFFRKSDGGHELNLTGSGYEHVAFCCDLFMFV
jgi:hypothetical protein